MRHVYFRIIFGVLMITASLIALLQGRENVLMTAVFGAVLLFSGFAQYKKVKKGEDR